MVIPRCFSSGALSISSNATALALPSSDRTCPNKPHSSFKSVFAMHQQKYRNTIIAIDVGKRPIDKRARLGLGEEDLLFTTHYNLGNYSCIGFEVDSDH
jgi:hypothetical protein